MNRVHTTKPGSDRLELPIDDDVRFSTLSAYPESLHPTIEVIVGEPTFSVIPAKEAHRFKRFCLETRKELLIMKWGVGVTLQRSAKRALDLTVSIALLPLILPFLLVTALAVKLESKGQVIFRQVRAGKWGKPFICYKFRSMYQDAETQKASLMHLNEVDGVVFKIRKDPRITRVGRIIRKTSLDELPQVFNVIKGDMSLVGPRPPVPWEVEQYSYDQLRRLDVLPGITGLQQVMGRSDIDFNRWVQLDLEYIHNECIGEDIKILLKTIPAVISGRGAY